MIVFSFRSFITRWYRMKTTQATIMKSLPIVD